MNTFATKSAICSMILLGVIAANTLADDTHTGTNTTQPSAAPDKSVSPIQAFKMAGDLAAWARQNSDPIQLATAARLLAANCQEMPKDANHTKAAAGGNDQKLPPDMPAFTPADLLKEARAMAHDNQDFLSAIDAIEKTMAIARGHPGGAFVDHDVLLPEGGTMTYTVTFAGNETMEVAVFANGPAAIDWHVYDENNNEVLSQSSDHFRSTPKWSGPFKVKLINKTKGYIPFTVATN